MQRLSGSGKFAEFGIRERNSAVLADRVIAGMAAMLAKRTSLAKSLCIKVGAVTRHRFRHQVQPFGFNFFVAGHFTVGLTRLG